MKLTIVVDLQWGSCGKGKLVSELARELPFDACAASNMPNAGHTVVTDDGRVVFKCLCSATPWTGVSLVTPASVFNTDRLEMEAAHAHGGVYIHENAQSLLPNDAFEEAEDTILRQVASTSP
jgi:adenylosuccinate synthase